MVLLLAITVGVYFITINYSANEISWFNKYDVAFEQYYNNYFLNKDASDIIIFEFNKNHFSNNLNYIFLNIFIYIFKIQTDQIIIFYKYINFFIFYLMISLLTVNIYKQWSYNKYSLLSIICFYFFINIISFWLINYCWIITFCLLIVFLHANKENEIRSNVLIPIINLCVLTGCFFDINYLVCVVIINLLQLFISYIQKKENATEYNINMLFSTLLMVSTIFNNSYYLSFIFILIVFSLYIIFLFYKTSKISKKINNRIDQFLYKKVYFIALLFIVAIWIVALILLFNVNNFNIDINPWFLVDDNQQQLNYYLVNVYFWVVNVIILLYALIKNDFWKFNKKEMTRKYFQNDLTLLLIIAFWNPISINFFNIINASQLIFVPFNLQAIFFSVLIPIIINSLSIILSTKKLRKIDYLINPSIILITTVIALININIGV